MEYILNNWPLVVAAIAVLVVAIVAVLNFIQKPTDEQIESFRQWILFIVIRTEKKLGSGTGKLKLRYAYDKFLERFPYLAKFISFDKFSEYVDQALEQMKELLNTNSNIQNYVEG